MSKKKTKLEAVQPGDEVKQTEESTAAEMSPAEEKPMVNAAAAKLITEQKAAFEAEVARLNATIVELRQYESYFKLNFLACKGYSIETANGK